ncbi:Protein PAIR1 [Bienertia sinuspersici]
MAFFMAWIRRRSNIMPQPRSQPSQQSFSQGISSQQNGMFSQLSQTSMDEVLTDNQRFSSQEKDNSVKRLSCLAPVSYTREESQVPITRSSSSLTRRWSSAAVQEHKCQLSDEVEHKISTMETSLNRLGMILDSVQADVMQVNKGTKELSLEAEAIRQKSISHHDTLHQLVIFRSLSSPSVLLSLQNFMLTCENYYDQVRSQEDTKASLESISNQLRILLQKDKAQEILLAVLDLRQQIDTDFQKNDKLSLCLSKDLQEIGLSLSTLFASIINLLVTGAESSSQKPFIRSEPLPIKVLKQTSPVPKVETGRWTTVKPEKTATNRYGNSCKNPKERRASSDREQKVLIELDDETDDDFSCMIFENQSDNYFVDELEEETAQILKKARRRKRKQDCKR